MKPGYLTTEFYVAVTTLLAVFVSALADALPPRYAAVASAIVAGLYAISRGLAKVYPPKPGP